MDALHFLRPAWFLALIPLAGLLIMLWRQRRAGRSWQAVVDPRLLPHLLIGGEGRRSPWGIAAVALGGLLAITALAGPVWAKLQQPVFRRESALVVLLDLSRSMDAGDLQPSRLQMAKFKLRDILARRKEGDTALIVYAADPFVVAPLTNDVATIARQLPSLTTDLMPAQGSRADRAIAKAQDLLRQAGAVHGDLLLITDGIDNDAPASLHEAVKKMLDAGYRLSMLGVGTADGAPIPLANGGFFKDDNGAIVMPKLDEDALAQLAAEGRGLYRRLAPDDSDTDALTGAFSAGWNTRQSQQVAGMKSDQWREEGPWLLLPLLLLAAPVFRRGYILVLLLAVMLPMPHSAYAMGWNDLWQRPDQRGAQALAARQPQQAATLFKDPQWRAAAHYRAGDYQAALNDLEKQGSAAAAYNSGNALAHLGKFPEALSAYEDALKRDPDFKDAAYNRDLVKKWLQSQRSSSSDKGQKGQNQSPQQNGQKQQQPGQQQSDTKGSQQGQQSSPQKGQNQSHAQADAQSAGKGDKASATPQRQGDSSGKNPDSAAAKDAQALQRDQHNDQNKQIASNATQPGEAASPQNESDRATEQWLRRIPDDPGGLWRRKFLYQYKKDYQSHQGEAKPW